MTSGRRSKQTNAHVTVTAKRVVFVCLPSSRGADVGVIWLLSQQITEYRPRKAEWLKHRTHVSGGVELCFNLRQSAL
ncbi:hypothetical protein TNCT_66321 [Trichonephila clavata]|uniref:Uncharacterized protein n=1 Tax=Trichonephila clavata TaxID=2740835 RepID=A0A8X6LMZ2_TRICU|nr:hypothetical protein TNCT_66321 [Trichonephila clavata]